MFKQLISVASAPDQSVSLTSRPSASVHDYVLHRAPKNREAPNKSVRREFDAAIFDMDGVVTNTAGLHSKAWKRMFDEYLRCRAATRHEAFFEFTHEHDYLGFVDGRPRDKGIEAFLNSRGINLPLGSSADPRTTESICGLGNHKNEVFHKLIQSDGVRLFESTIGLIHAMLQIGIRIGLATSSKNAAAILEKTGVAPLFATVVDGIVSAQRGLRGKPEPDIFAAALADLNVQCSRAIVFEDAISGVQGGVRGGFALVVGVAREGNVRELRDAGADLVVTDLGETSVDQINQLITAKRAGW
jgi:beta-phosphoglucomutase family hydrolase